MDYVVDWWSVPLYIDAGYDHASLVRVGAIVFERSMRGYPLAFSMNKTQGFCACSNLIKLIVIILNFILLSPCLVYLQ